MYGINNLPATILIGRRTETGVEEIAFDCSGWLEKWPGMQFSILAMRPGEADAYPAAIRKEGAVVVWEVNSSDTAIAGCGYAELIGIADGKRKIICTINTRIMGIKSDTVTEPPEAAKPWVDQVLEAAKRAEDAAERAEGAGGGGSGGSGGITKETDPTVPAWAKQPNKPTYTAEDVGAASKAEVERLSDEKADRFTVGEGLQMDEGVLEVVPEPVYELIETIVCDGTYGNISCTNLALTHAKIYIHTQAATKAISVGAEARNTAGMFGYAWIGNGINTGERWAYVYFVSDGKNAYCEHIGPVSALYSTAAIAKTVERLDASTPINRIGVYASGGEMLPAGSTIEIWGVRA